MAGQAVNAGPRAINGFALQRNMAIFLLLTHYEYKFKNKNYFISLEHHDDFLFCFENDAGEALSVEAFQSKKKSTDIWTINEELAGIIKKMMGTGIELNSDTSLVKAKGYSHQLFFSSNTPIKLQKIIPKADSKTASKTITMTINEENVRCSFEELDVHIKNKILDFFGGKLTVEQSEELSNVHFSFTELTRTESEQRIQLIGKLGDLFGKDINDKNSAIKTIFLMFEKVNSTYNQRGVARMLDASKRITNSDVEKALELITARSKAFDYWRDEKKDICKALMILPQDKTTFEFYFESSFDLFKDLKEAEHQKILNFVKNKYSECSNVCEEDNVSELFYEFRSAKNSSFEDLNLKAVIYAAYFEIINKKEY
jgi:hypothetical protein